MNSILSDLFSHIDLSFSRFCLFLLLINIENIDESLCADLSLDLLLDHKLLWLEDSWEHCIVLCRIIPSDGLGDFMSVLFVYCLDLDLGSNSVSWQFLYFLLGVHIVLVGLIQVVFVSVWAVIKGELVDQGTLRAYLVVLRLLLGWGAHISLLWGILIGGHLLIDTCQLVKHCCWSHTCLLHIFSTTFFSTKGRLFVQARTVVRRLPVNIESRA